MTALPPAPAQAAYRLTHILNAFAQTHGTARFPVDVEHLALGCASLFGWADPIAKVQAADIEGFEGALFAGEQRQRWALLYNDRIRSPGRIRFTQAHELGHYMLHRALRDSFECTDRDMTDWSKPEANWETQADSFAATLLMPLDDFRLQSHGAPADFDALGHFADRYGVSLTAATLRWLEHTDTCAVLLVHRDGFINWTAASRSARRAGARLWVKGRAVPVPEGSLAQNSTVAHERLGGEVSAAVWYPAASPGLSLRECKITADHYDTVMTLLVLPRSAFLWPAAAGADD